MKVTIYFALLLSLASLSTFSWNVFYNDNIYFSKQTHVYNSILTEIEEHYDKYVSNLENKVYASIRSPTIQNFFAATYKGSPTRYTISFSDPLLINFYLIDAAETILYAYSPFPDANISFPSQSGTTILDQETLAITSFLPQLAGARVVFLFKLRDLMHQLFTETMPNYQTERLTIYRYAFIYTIIPHFNKIKHVREIELLVDNSYEHVAASSITEALPPLASKLNGKKLPNGLILGISYKNYWVDVPLLSWVILLTLTSLIILLVIYLVFHQNNTISRNRPQPYYKRFFSSPRNPPPTAAEPNVPTLQSEKISVDTPPPTSSTPAYPAITTLAQELDDARPHNAVQTKTLPPPSSAHIEKNAAVQASPENLLSPQNPPPPQLYPQHYKKLIKALKHNAKILLSHPNKLPFIRELAPCHLPFILILERTKPYVPFAVAQCHGIDLSTAQALIVAENERLFKQFLAHNNAVLVRHANHKFFPQRLSKHQLARLAHIHHLLIVPLKPKNHKRISMLILVG